MNTTPNTEAKIAKFIYKNLPTIVARAGVHPIFCRLNLHNNKFLKAVNTRAGIVYKMAYCQNELITERYDQGGETKVDDALLAIKALLKSDWHAYHKDYIVKRIEFLTNEALQAYYSVSRDSWVERVHNAIQEAKRQEKAKSKKKPTITKSKKKPVQKKKLVTKSKKVTKRARNSKGQFIKARKRR
jgi:hypothetical protein